jgi:hypothetical protein
MSDRSMWKLLHLLYTVPPRRKPGLSYSELTKAGIDCDPDTVQPLVQSGAIEQMGDRYVLSAAAQSILRTCVVANRRWGSWDIWVDYPKVFVVMPFSEPWSRDVYSKMIRPAVKEAGLECVRGDTSLRVGDLTQNIWNEVLQAGVIVADVSALNANVFYELGLAHALGKEVFIFKRKDAKIPADFGGAHYYEYELQNLRVAKKLLRDQLKALASAYKFHEVKAIRGN